MCILSNYLKKVDYRFFLKKTIFVTFQIPKTPSSFAIKDIKEAVILPHVKIIQYGSFSNTFELESVTFSSNSELRKFEDCTFANSRLQKLVLPAGIKEITAIILFL